MNGAKVAFALLLYDEFGGTPIRDASVLFRVDGRLLTPLRKRDGFYVFLEPQPPELTLDIARPHFQREQAIIRKGDLAPGYPVVRVRLLREQSGVFSDCRWFAASCPAGADAIAYGETPLKLSAIDSDTDGLKATFTGFGAGLLTGKRLALDQKSGETFIATEMLAPHVYRVDRKPSRGVKSGAPIYRAYLSRAGADGCCRLPVETDDISITQVRYWKEADQQWDCVSATALS